MFFLKMFFELIRMIAQMIDSLCKITPERETRMEGAVRQGFVDKERPDT